MISIVLTGPESTGKSVLTQQLSKHFNGFAVNEYAREYVEGLQRPYTFEDVELIAKHQMEAYSYLKATKGQKDFIFFDTYLIITKVWFEEVFNSCPDWVDKAIRNSKIDLALLCFPDLSWETDGVRENPNRREYLYQRYLKELEFYEIPFCIVRGRDRIRTDNAIGGVNKWIGKR
ncbi:AAA family ATPase [Thermophagus sp. OGC60D27]|uniref:AAA family ATPase n=1 Tax=Thermophagus sp. OGC60D27 TaxID=3458415 RepID=UPI004037CDD5